MTDTGFFFNFLFLINKNYIISLNKESDFFPKIYNQLIFMIKMTILYFKKQMLVTIMLCTQPVERSKQYTTNSATKLLIDNKSYIESI